MIKNRAIRVLLVEDEDAHARLTEVRLGQSKLARFVVDRARSGADARDRAAVRRYDAVIVDFRLGDADGLMLVEELRATGVPGPFLLLTNYGSEHVAAAALRARVDDYLPKMVAFQGDELARVVTGLVERRRLIEEVARLREQGLRLDGAVKTARRVAHELNNQLSYLTGYGDLLARSLSGEQAEMASEIVLGARAASQTVEQLQRMVRFEEVDGGLGQGAMLDIEAAIAP